MDDHVALLVTVVLAAEDERTARSACQDLRGQAAGRIVETADCSAEEPGCWSVTMRVPSEERATHNMAAPLARAVRQFIRGLGPTFLVPHVSCEPPTAWTVLEDPDAVESLVAGADRILVEAWTGSDPYPATDNTETESNLESSEPPTETEKTTVTETDSIKVTAAPEPTILPPAISTEPAGCRLTLRVDVAATRAAGAEWQARALASRISRTATLAGITEQSGVISVIIDLGTAPTPAPQTVLTAASALDRSGWSALRWEGATAITTSTTQPRPEAGIIQLELSAGPPTKA